ncbi:ubiquitin-associated protein 1 isoform X2 [Aplysia californica]|uniref:Ubiquitin-associated protein 1 isoform X2 n=1 Tax=Aplysia californica TaxID=6500 RepID=A0ABM0K0U1_APLCA|nr:ubiquitin-associated protein 1 isoform X2 [Aplysia californica]
MDDRLYGTLGRHGLASSNSYLDGVPFKIGQNFKQPAKTVAPPELSRTNSQRVLNVEYTFETEEAVLAWAKARDEALQKAAKEQAEKAEQAEQEQKRLEAEAVAAASSSQKQTDGAISKEDSNASVYDVPKSTPVSGIERARPRVPPKPPVAAPRTMSEPGMILKPIPIQATAASKSHSSNVMNDGQSADNSEFDVSMFEQEADPFENLELQTINDMEELKVLLDSSKPIPAPRKNSSVSRQQSANTEVSEAPPATCDNVDGTESIYDVATVVKENKWVTFDNEENIHNCSSKNEDLKSQSFKDELVAREDGEYVEITDFKQQTSKNHTVNGVNKNVTLPGESDSVEASLGGKLPPNLASSKLYKPVLPPIPGPHRLNGNCDNPKSSAEQNSSFLSNSFMPQPSQSLNPFLQGAAESKNPFATNNPADSGVKNPFAATSASLNQTPTQGQIVGPSKSSGRPLRTPPPVPSKPDVSNRPGSDSFRMWSSVGPSLAASLDDSSVRSPAPMKNPYSRHSVSTTDLQTSGRESDLFRKSPALDPLPSSSPRSGQPLNKMRPLPPPPSPSPKPEVYKESQLPTSPPVGLTDPYHSLSREAQAFTDSLTSMGFLKARVARAVQKFGQDQKEVLDHLFAVDKLVAMKYAPVLVESTLYTLKNDVEKAENFLKMLDQFEELGFKRESIQEALVTADMDREKALDLLTG